MITVDRRKGTPPARLSAQDLATGYGQRRVIDELNLVIADHQVTTIIGPNGCGKSTLLRALARLVAPQAGQVVLDGKSIHALSTRHVATRLTLLPQTPLAPDGLLVRDLVGRGRHPHQSWLHQCSKDDETVIEQVMGWTSISDLAERPIDQLSGGQRQRAWIAMALAQNTELLLLDEPTTHLDLAHQVELLELVRRLNRERGRTIVMVLHDLNLAARYSDHLVVMAEGTIVAQGSPRSVLTAEVLQSSFGLKARIMTDPESGRPLVVPRWEGQADGSEPLVDESPCA